MLRSFYRFVNLSIIFFASLTQLLEASEHTPFHGWIHLELGAGNYGPDGHTKASQEMTVLMKIANVSDAENYIHNLEEYGRGAYPPEDQYGVLFWTLDQLIQRHGPVGVFHINDLYEKYAHFASCKLQEYARTQGYDSVIIESIPGDYQTIDSKKTLSKYGKAKYSSAHLKNPEVSFYHDTMDGHFFSASANSRKKTRELLQHLANLSEEGIYLFIIYDDHFVPNEEKQEWMERDIFYHRTNQWESVPYIFPEGDVIHRDRGRVFFVPSEG